MKRILGRKDKDDNEEEIDEDKDEGSYELATRRKQKSKTT